MEYLADTVAIIRHLSGQGPMGREAKKIFRETEEGTHLIWISIISLMEIMYLSKRHRIPISLSELKDLIAQSINYRIAPLEIETLEVAFPMEGLELHDQLIVATAKLMEIPLITSDGMIRDSGLALVIWD